MRLLLDTHAVLWALTDSPRLSRRAAAFIGNADNQPLISPVVAYEICAKHKLGKLPEAEALAADFEGQLALLDIEWLPINAAHAIAAGKLDMSHRDPFDRLLIAQALIERVPMISNEAVFDGFGVERIW
ncbi:MAG: type II toxin-antitoxin system VapC family toxin [Sphingomonas sp.]|nr:type II toxin-antitoxin system VapC family toxin [Sphingomonas sp.]